MPGAPHAGTLFRIKGGRPSWSQVPASPKVCIYKCLYDLQSPVPHYAPLRPEVESGNDLVDQAAAGTTATGERSAFFRHAIEIAAGIQNYA